MVAVWNSEPAQKTERPLYKPLELYSNVLASWLQRCGETIIWAILHHKSALLVITAFTKSHCISANSNNHGLESTACYCKLLGLVLSV